MSEMFYLGYICGLISGLLLGAFVVVKVRFNPLVSTAKEEEEK